MRTKIHDIFKNDPAYLDGKWNDLQIVMSSHADVDNNSQFDNYIILKWDVLNNSAFQGDGLTKVRKSECDIILLTNGVNNLFHTEMEMKIAELLEFNKYNYNLINLDYDKDLNKSISTFSILIYGF